jgi:glycine cleavage system H protein
VDYPTELKYHPEHMWVLLEGEIATVGVTDFAQDQLGEVLYLDLPQAGEVVSIGEELGAVESAKSVSDLASPVSGVVTESNHDLEDDPTMVNSDPYGDGWIARIKLDDLAELDELLDAKTYQASLK